MKLLIDMNLSPVWVSEGIDAMRTNKPSIIQVRAQDIPPVVIGDLVLRAIRAAAPHLEAGALVTVDSLRHRVRLLPI
jgi:predicted nuclease of predicted toxin-antitoxin system